MVLRQVSGIRKLRHWKRFKPILIDGITLVFSFNMWNAWFLRPIIVLINFSLDFGFTRWLRVVRWRGVRTVLRTALWGLRRTRAWFWVITSLPPLRWNNCWVFFLLYNVTICLFSFRNKTSLCFSCQLPLLIPRLPLPSFPFPSSFL